MYVIYFTCEPPEIWWGSKATSFIHVINRTAHQLQFMRKSDSLWMIPGTVDPRDD